MAGSTVTVLPPPYISAAYLKRNAAQLSKMNGHWELFLDYTENQAGVYGM